MSGDLDNTGTGCHGGGGRNEPPDLKAEKQREQADDAPRELSERSAAVGSGVGRALEKPRPFHHDSLQFCPRPPDESNLRGVVGPAGPFWYTRTARVLSPANSPRRSLMPQLVLPARHEWLVNDRTHGQIAVEPFEPGFALTVGNAYRRVLLSSIPGAAPTWAKIEGVLHEFSHLQGVNEDTLDIIMNLRQLVFVLHVNRPKLLRLRAQGPRTVTAGDFDQDADVEILTPEVALATLDKDGTLEMEVCVERGRGYQPAEKREPEALPINAMLIDADFSPVKRANFSIENLPAASGPGERLVLELWTNGSVGPEPAVAEASRILEDQFDLLSDFKHIPPPPPENGEPVTELP